MIAGGPILVAVVILILMAGGCGLDFAFAPNAEAGEIKRSIDVQQTPSPATRQQQQCRHY
jgi:hypothetical protein